MGALGKAGVSSAMVTADYFLPYRVKRQLWKSMLTIDLFQAWMLRGAARRGVRDHRPRAILYATSHSALLQPRRRSVGRVGIRFDAPARLSRQGRGFAIEHWLERRQFERARILAPVGVSLDPSIASILPENSSVVPLPIPIESGPTTGQSRIRERIVVAYAASPHKKGLDRILQAWSRVAQGDRRLVITGIARDAGRGYLRERGIPEPAGIEWRGRLSLAEHRALTSRAEIYVAASRFEDYGLAQLEALADGSILVTAPSPGPFVALPIARELDPRLVADGDGADDLARALQAAFDMTDEERTEYRGRAGILLRPFSADSLEQRVRDELLPALLSEAGS